jgi:hypothetical protein
VATRRADETALESWRGHLRLWHSLCSLRGDCISTLLSKRVSYFVSSIWRVIDPISDIYTKPLLFDGLADEYKPRYFFRLPRSDLVQRLKLRGAALSAASLSSAVLGHRLIESTLVCGHQ